MRTISGVPEHLALSYTTWGPTDPDGKIPTKNRQDWLDKICRVPINPDYRVAFDRWKSSFTGRTERVVEFQLTSRLLVGHGNASAADVGLTVHHTWGVPVIPGSAIKGVVSHYVGSAYGPVNPHPLPWELGEENRDRARWQPPIGNRGPGAAYRSIFGAGTADFDDRIREHGLEAGAIAGGVAFYDAMFVPSNPSHVFVPDVLTVHNRRYYETQGDFWPNDYDDPNPVSFLTVAPGVRMLFAFSAPADLLDLVERVVSEALVECGIGGKTTSGYGRFINLAKNPPKSDGAATSSPRASTPSYRPDQKIVVTRIEDNTKGKMRFQADDGLLCQFLANPPNIALGDTVEAWVRNTGQIYTLDLQPRQKKK